MHPGQLELRDADVAVLIGEQFPQWQHLPIRAVPSDGTVNALFRLGDDLVARFPLVRDDPARVLRAVEAEIAATSTIGPATTVRTPEFVVRGRPGAHYPLPWTVYRWIAGTVATSVAAGGSTAVARDLARFVLEVRALDSAGRSFEGTGRGGRLADHDEDVADRLRAGADMIDTVALERLWSRLRETPRSEPDLWTHGDLMPGNLLVDLLDDGDRLVGVLDLGQAGVADPALDLQPAWNLFGPAARVVFRRAVGADDDAWDRGKGWALAQAIGCLAYYRETNPVMSRIAAHTLRALLDDEARPRS